MSKIVRVRFTRRGLTPTVTGGPEILLRTFHISASQSRTPSRKFTVPDRRFHRSSRLLHRSVDGLAAVVLFATWMGAAVAAHAEPNSLESAEASPTRPTSNGPEKRGCSFLEPTPSDRMRPLSTDRPGKSHSSLTVDCGHFQVESDFFIYTYDRFSPDRQTTRSYSIGTPILKYGVTNWADVEVGLALYNEQRVSGQVDRSSQKATGFGDLLVGAKFNVFGNDGGDQSFALLPFVKLPTAAPSLGNNVVEYTLAAPYTVALTSPWSVTFEPGLGLLKNVQNFGYHGDYSFIINVNRPVFVDTVTAALELFGEVAGDRHIPAKVTLDPSLQWLVMPNLQLDIGAYIGLNKAAPDYVAYTGISVRF